MLICQYIREIMRFSLLRKFINRKGRKRKLITYAAWSYNSTYQNTLMNWMVCSRVLSPFFWCVEQFCLNKFEEMCLVFFSNVTPRIRSSIFSNLAKHRLLLHVHVQNRNFALCWILDITPNYISNFSTVYEYSLSI